MRLAFGFWQRLALAAGTACALWLATGACSAITLRVSNWAGPEEIAIEEANLREFEGEHPGVRVVLEPIPQNYREKLLVSFAGGSPPDVFLLDAIIVPSFVNRDLLLDLMPRAQRLGVDLSDFYPNVLDIAKRGERLYALPKDFTPMVMYYNRDLLDRFSVPHPRSDWTWQQFLDTARRLTRDVDGDGRVDYYGTLTYPKFFYFPPWVWSKGGDFLDPTGRRATGYLDSALTTEALQFLIDLRTAHHVAPSAQVALSLGGTETMFFSGRVAMAESGHWWLPKLKKYMADGSIRVGVVRMPTPAGGKHQTVLYASGWCVARATRHPDLAAELAVYLSSVRANRRRAEQSLAIPANRSLAEEVLANDRSGLEKVFYEEIPFARAPWGAKVEPFPRVEQVTEDAFEEALLGRSDLAVALHRAAVEADQALKPGPKPKLSGEVQVALVVFATLIALTLVVVGLCAKERGRARSAAVSAYAFISPSLLHLGIFALAPLAFSLYLAFHQWSIIEPTKPLVGFANFAHLLRDRLFWNAVRNTAVYSLHVPVAMAMSLGVAMLMNRRLPGVRVFRTLFFLPSVCSFVALAMAWKWLYNPEFGLLNHVIRLLGGKPVGWLSDPWLALPALMLMSIWLSLGYQMVIFLAGLQGIPATLYEAALIDGASGWQRFRSVTLPLLRPTTLFVLVTSVIASFQVFTAVYVMTQGGPVHATDVIVYHIYQSAWENLQMGYASAMAWILFVLIAVATLIQFKSLGGEVTYQ